MLKNLNATESPQAVHDNLPTTIANAMFDNVRRVLSATRTYNQTFIIYQGLRTQ